MLRRRHAVVRLLVSDDDDAVTALAQFIQCTSEDFSICNDFRYEYADLQITT